jgi:hypothetical protein
VITDDNAWWEKHGANLPALTRFRWDRPLDDQLRAVIGDAERAIEAASTGRAFALHHFSNHDITRCIASFAEQVRESAAKVITRTA